MKATRLTVLLLVILGAVSPLLRTPRALAQVCPGDCDGNGSIDISELVVLTDIALGDRPVSACAAGDTTSDGGVGVPEIIAAVKAALDGCPALPLTVESAVLRAVRGLAQLPPLAEAISVALDGVGGPDLCELGGGLESSCEDSGGGFLQTQVGVRDCRVNSAAGAIDYNGDVTVTAPGQCPNVTVLTDLRLQFDLTAISEASDGSPLLQTDSSGPVILQSVAFGDPPCSIKGGTVSLGATFTYRPPADSPLTLAFDGDATANTEFIDFLNDDRHQCDPISVAMTVAGRFEVSEPTADAVEQRTGMTATDLRLTVHSDTRTLEVEGTIAPDGVGGSAHLSTPEPLGFPLGHLCFTAGVLRIAAPGGASELRFAADGSVAIDLGADGTVDASRPSCPALQ